MTNRPLARARLVAQGVVRPSGSRQSPEPTVANSRPVHEHVRGFVAMQGQDLPGVISSIALRAGTDADTVIRAFDDGEIVRAYPMRGTVFAMAADDAAWVSELCNAPMVRAAANRRAQLGLEDHHMHTAEDVLHRAVATSPTHGVCRADLLAAWNEAGIATDAGRGYHLIRHFISVGTAVYGRFGPDSRRDNNVMLADDWLPAGSTLEARFNGDDVHATAELLHRYVRSHGPVTLHDAAWWSKLPLRLLRPAAELTLQSHDDVETGTWTHDGEPHYWRAGLHEEVRAVGRRVNEPLLLPGFDEVILGYPDRMYIVPAAHHEDLVPGNNGVFRAGALAGAEVIGFWKRGPVKKSAPRRLVLAPFATVSEARRRKLATRFAQFPFPT